MKGNRELDDAYCKAGHLLKLYTTNSKCSDNLSIENAFLFKA